MRVLILLAIVAVAAATPVPWTNCGKPSDHIKISSVSATPYPPVKGQELTVTVEGSVDESVTAGKYTIKVAYSGIQLLDKSGDICTLDPTHFQCPVAKGNLDISKSLTLPSIAPSGSYQISISAQDQNGQELLCAQLGVNISSTASIMDIVLDQYAPAVSHEMVEHINSLETTWTAGFNKRLDGLTLSDVRGLCGALPEPNMPPVKVDATTVVFDLPSDWDAREAWPNCASLNEIRDQGSCGSCWATAAAEAMTDRICIATSAQSTPHLAIEDIMSCCGFSCGMGCSGGYPSAAWNYFVNTGVVTGGPYGSGQGCAPYLIPSCDHHVNGTKAPCGSILPTPACKRSCDNGLVWSQDKHFGKTSYSVASDVESIQKELMQNGPVEAAFTVYADFPTYRSGVYQHTEGSALGGHAVKIIGWGVDNGTPYWTVANSWNTDWGDKGFFKILRGQDECGIESSIVAGSIPTTA